MSSTPRLLVLALASALASITAPVFAQNPPPTPAPQPADSKDADKDKVQLEQDALNPAATPPAVAPLQTAKGAGQASRGLRVSLLLPPAPLLDGG